MSDKLILAVDPGGTTGWSYTSTSTLEVGGVPFAGQLPPQEFCEFAEAVSSDWGENLIMVVERFTISNRTLKVSRGGSYDAIEVIGVCRFLSLRDCRRDLEMSQPSTVMNLFPDKWLKERGWYKPGLPHGNDSLRHLAKACAKRGLIRVGQSDIVTPDP